MELASLLNIYTFPFALQIRKVSLLIYERITSISFEKIISDS